MREQRHYFEKQAVKVFVVTFERTDRVIEFRSENEVPFPILRDPSRAAYKAFGFKRPLRSAFWAPSTARYYLRQVLHGKLPRLARSDYLQLGGDVLLSPHGDPCWVYMSAEPADRPTIDRLRKAVHECVGD